MTRILTASHVFDGWTLHAGAAVSLCPQGRITALYRAGTPLPGSALDLGAGLLAPGLVDLQVNGGAGQMIGADTDAAQIAQVCMAHARLGASAILPTLITDTPEVTQRVIAAAQQAARDSVPGFAGLHLEGPHLDQRRKGAHDPALIRPMTPEDLTRLCDAAQTLPALIVTLAPESASPDQIAALHAAGVIVSLGHSDCTAAQAHAAHAAGARCVTHLFNAMSGLGARSPGLAGACLTSALVAGIIADGVHVAPESLRVALEMKGPNGLFVVSDAMAVAGTDLREFHLNGRRILRADGRLTLGDGTLAGADISLPQSLAHLVGLGVPRARALAMVSRIPADVIAAQDRGRIAPGARADLILLDDRLHLRKVWIGGQALDL